MPDKTSRLATAAAVVAAFAALAPVA
ncbi:MAG: hypothetical protein QG550_2861, partial [Pseudomonadota bacterium]|nr:hypothetical protein [Pseudomonadota bacterium]